MKILLRLAKEAVRYRGWLLLAIFGTLALTAVNLIAPSIMSSMVGMVSDGLTSDDLNTILLMAGTLCGLYLIRILFRFLSSYCSHLAGWKLVLELRVKVYNTIQTFSMDFFHDKQTGDLIARTMQDVATFEHLYAHILPDTITNFVTLIGVTIIIFSINPTLALITCIPIPFIVLAGWLYSKKVRPKFKQMQKAQGDLSAQLQDNYSGIKEIQAFGHQKNSSKKVKIKAEEFTKNMLSALKYMAVFSPGIEFLTSLGMVIVIGFGGYLAIHNRLSVADIVAFLLYLSLFYAPITSLSNLLETIQTALAGAERVIEVVDAPQTVTDMPGAKAIGKVKGQITFNNVSFSYVEGVPILKDVSFDAKPGQMIALVGSTGVGKTTLSQLIARFYDPTEGNICIDGIDIKSVTLESLRKNISIVLQDTFLFNGTIEDNIAFARPKATFEEIKKAAKTARIHDEILDMPDGYQSLIGERGLKLSGGQKQRLAIARAVLCQAPILVLDEATASVDVRTEAHIQSAINELAGSLTIVTIAHRLSTVRNADVIFVFEKGRIVQSGNHNELINQEGLYKRLCAVQEVDV